MTDTKVYILPSSSEPHISILIYKDGKTTRIDGNQSAGYLTPSGELPVNDPKGPFGNVIIEIGQVSGEVFVAGAQL